MLRNLVLLSVIQLIFPAIAVLAQEPVPLPVRKVVLYKNGIGYFEHLGMVKGPQAIEIMLPSAQLNDVLKSLTVLDLGGGQVDGVNYDSNAPLDRRLAEMPFDISPTQGLAGFLNQIRGAGVEINAPGGVVTGKLMGAEMHSRSSGTGGTTQSIQVSIFLPSGEVRLVDLASAGALKLTEPSMAADLERYLELLDARHRRDVRRLKIQTSGSGERRLYMSYTAESPIWKSTYRIVLDAKQKPLLQGWAIVDNTTPMDWRNVTLSLVAGAPVSFVQNLSQPLYARRPVVPLPEGLQVSPQVHEATLEEGKEMPAAGVAAGAVLGAPAPAAARREMLVMDSPRSSPPGEAISGLADALRQRASEAAQAQALGEQFEYELRQPVTIRRNESALLPILQSDVEGEKVAIFSSDNGERHPRLAFWLKNTSGLTLDAGSFSVIDSNAFAGEGLFETIHSGESRLLSYAIDLGSEISANRSSERQRVERVQISRGIMRMHAKIVEKKTYVIRNNNDRGRVVVLEHPVRTGWILRQTAPPVESTANSYRFRIDVKAKATTEFVVREESPQETTIAISGVTPEQILLWVRDRSIDPEIESALADIAAKKNQINDLTQEIAALGKEEGEIFRDQERVRGNLQRLGPSPEEAALRQRYIREMEQQENRLAVLRAERNRLETSRIAAQKQLDDLIQNLSLDKKLPG